MCVFGGIKQMIKHANFSRICKQTQRLGKASSPRNRSQISSAAEWKTTAISGWGEFSEEGKNQFSQAVGHLQATA